MKHAREDYNRIQDPALTNPELLSEGSTAILEDEPVFLIRAQDFTAPDVVEFWAYKAEQAGAKRNIIIAARQQAKKMRDWQIDLNRAKIPDMP